MERIGKYELEYVVGRGGFGKVWRARDTAIRRPVAIKVLQLAGTAEAEAKMLARFTAEAETMAGLEHPNIVTIHEFGAQDGIPYIVMEYVEGPTFQELTERPDELTLPEKLRAMMQVAAGLEYAHERGVIHRDIKPGNLMRRGADGVVKIMDFGIAKLADAQRASLTQTGFLIGSFGYMAPELFEGQQADAQTDIFAAGLVFHELLTKRPAFAGQSPASRIGAMRDGRRTNLDDALPPCPPALRAVLDRALAVDRENRYESMEELSLDLRPLLIDLQRGEANELAAEAERQLAAGAVAAARVAQRKALALDPLNALASALRDPLREKERALPRPEPEVQRILKQAEALLHDGDPAEAGRVLERLRDQHGEIPEAEPLLRTACERMSACRQDARLKTKLEYITQLEREQKTTLALEAAREAAVDFPDHLDITRILARLGESTTRVEPPLPPPAAAPEPPPPETPPALPPQRAEPRRRIALVAVIGALTLMCFLGWWMMRPAPVTLRVSPEVLEFDAELEERQITIDTANPLPDGRVELRSTGTWLLVNTASWPLPAAVRVVADARGLAPGEYQGELIIRESPSGSEKRIRALLRVPVRPQANTDFSTRP